MGFSEQCSKNNIIFRHWHPKPMSQQEHFNHYGRAYNITTADSRPYSVAFPELVSGGVSKSHKFNGLVKVGAVRVSLE